MYKRKRLGDVLLDEGWINADQLQRALDYQSSKNVRIGKALTELGFVTEETILHTLSKLFNIPIKQVDTLIINSDVFNIVSKGMINEYRFFPFNFDETSISILIDDPVNTVILGDVKQLLRMDLNVYLVQEVELERLIDKHLNQNKIIEGLTGLESIEKEVKLFDVSSNIDDSAVAQAVNNYLKHGYLDAASDIHFDVTDKELLVRYRVDGELRIAHTLPKASATYMIARLKLMSNLNTTETRVPQDGALQMTINGKTVDLRISTVPALYGEKIVVRILDNDKNIKKLHEVGFSQTNLDKIKKVIQNPFGMILVTGPTGSGKSTLLYTFIHHVFDVAKNIITIEDPVEYKFPGITQISVNQASGLTFPVGLRAILRQDPNIILIGEIRDEITASIAVKASNTGHLVFSTLHTNSAASSITRLPEMGVEKYLVTSSLVGVVNQRLVRKVCQHCAEYYTSKHTDEERKTLELKGTEEFNLKKAMGCKQCNETGYSGRVPIHEVLIIDNDLRQLITDNKSLREIEEKAIQNGMVTLKEDGFQKVKDGLTTLEELRKHVI